MRIAFFTDVYRPTINGVVVSIDTFASSLRAQGHRVTIICPEYNGYNDKESDDVLRIKAVTFPSYKEYRMATPLSLRIDKHMRRNTYDVIHIHSPFSVGLAGIFYAKKYKLPVIYTAHTNYSSYLHYTHAEILVPKNYVDKLVSGFSNRIDLTIAPSKKVLDSLIEFGTTKPVQVLSTGIPDPTAGDGKIFREKYKLNDSLLFVYLGRIAKEKNLEFLVDAFCMALPKLPKDSTLVIVGDGPYTETLKEYIADKGINRRIKFTGFIDGACRADAYSAMDIFCHVSHTETQGLTLMEASSYGIPMIVPKDSAYEGVAVDGINSIVVDGDVNEYADRMILLGNDKKMRSKLSKGALKLSSKFKIESRTNELIELYNRVITNKRIIIHKGSEIKDDYKD